MGVGHAQQALERDWRGGVAPVGWGRAFKVLAPIYFAYDWSQGGLGHAVNEALWPVSELWNEDED